MLTSSYNDFFLVPSYRLSTAFRLHYSADSLERPQVLSLPCWAVGKASPHRGVGRCCDGSSRQWSIKMRWNTPKGIQVQNLPETKSRTITRRKTFTLLPRYGCPITLDYGKSLHDFLQEIRNELPVIVDVQTPGWFQDSQYVLPEESVGVTAETIPYLSSDGYQEMYRCRGTLEGWKKLAELACGNTRLEFALCSAFAAPLLRLLNVEGGGFHFVGKSSSGKTTALTLPRRLGAQSQIMANHRERTGACSEEP